MILLAQSAAKQKEYWMQVQEENKRRITQAIWDGHRCRDCGLRLSIYGCHEFLPIWEEVA